MPYLHICSYWISICYITDTGLATGLQEMKTLNSGKPSDHEKHDATR